MPKTKFPPLSNASLTTLASCQRRFYLRYLSELGWPLMARGDVQAAEESEQLGKWFHLAVEQRAWGQDVTELLNRSPRLHGWWLGFLKNRFDRPKGEVWHEARLTFAFGGERIMVVMDRLQHLDGKWIIWDWKTGRSFDRERLATSWQTRLYRFALAHAGEIFHHGTPIAPEAITMTYWSAEHDQLEHFPYDAAQYAEDTVAIQAAIAELHAAEAAGFPATGKPFACQAKHSPCPFVPLCFAGDLPAGDADAEVALPDPLDEDDDPFI